MLITHHYLKTLEQVETTKTRKQMILNQCDELEHDLQLAINACQLHGTKVPRL